MDLTGTIIAVLPAQSGVSQRTGNPWMSQEYVIEVPGMYPRKTVFRIFGEDRIKQFALQQGQQNVTIQLPCPPDSYHNQQHRPHRRVRQHQQPPSRQQGRHQQERAMGMICRSKGESE